MKNINLEYAPEIGDLRFRTFAGEADFARIAEIDTASSQFDGLPFSSDVAEIANDWAHAKNFDAARDAIFAELAGETVAYGRANWNVNDAGVQVWMPFAFSKPVARRKGIGTAIMRWLIARCEQQASENPRNGPREAHAWSMDATPGKAKVLEQAGFEQFRYGFMMKRPLDAPIPDLPLPEGVQVRAVEASDMPALFWALSEAFADHFGHAPSTESDLKRFLNDPLNKPSLFQVAWDTATNQIAGGVLNNIFHDDNARLGVKRGWTDPIFVRRPWRKRGLASALVVRSMRLFKDVGINEAYLGVDGLNPSGALKIYEGLGYVVDHRTYRWKRVITP